MLDFMQAMAERTVITKTDFGRMVHSDDQDEMDQAMAALEEAGGYDNLED